MDGVRPMSGSASEVAASTDDDARPGGDLVARSARPVAAAHRRCRFGLSAPRNFLYPALLLLVEEEPRHGYALLAELEGFRLGNVDRPSVYRALAQLEQDGLVEHWSETSEAGTTRTVYAATEAGVAALGEWITVVNHQRDGLDRVLARFAALDDR